MGQCGCGDYRPNVKFPGPDGSTYTLEIHDSCRYCETPFGVVITRHPELTDENDDYLVRELPDVDFMKVDDAAAAHFALLDPNLLRKKLEDVDLIATDRLQPNEAVDLLQEVMIATRKQYGSGDS